jgi:thiamine biosynthesis lipoprotein
MNRRYVMGTFLSVRIAGDQPKRLQRVFLDEVQRLENLLSIYRPESEISRINRDAGTVPMRVSPETYEIVAEALRYAELSRGAFDPTLQPAGYRRLVLNVREGTVFLSLPGMKLDLGGIGKGFALDRALAKVRVAGDPESVTADFGGQLLFWHRMGSFGPETIVIEDPVSGGEAATFQIGSNGSVSTSSNAERPGHILDPRLGESARALAGVTIAAPTGTQAEALSTAVFVMGEESGRSWLKQFSNVQTHISRYGSSN